MDDLKIKKEDFFKINEDDVLFITNPGRMGDEDGSTFVIKQEEDYITYRINGWMYPTNEEDRITLEEARKQFPKWSDAWKNGSNDKYQYIYMGFGNGLCVDNLVYEEYKKYLDEDVKDYLTSCSRDNKEDLEYAAIFNTWKKSLVRMINHK